jgi:hypothetical protein
MFAAVTATGCGSSDASPPASSASVSASSASAASTTSTTSSPQCPLATSAPDATTARMTLRRRPSARDPLRAMLVGDSIATTLAPSLAVGFDELTKRTGIPHTEMASVATPGFGFAAALPGIIDGDASEGFDAYRDWPKIIDDAITKYDPDVVVILVGSWDMVQREVDGKLINPQSCDWPAWYRGLTETAWQHLTAKGARVAWLAFPCTVQEENPYHYTLNSVFRLLAGAHADSVAYVDLDRKACPTGEVVRAMRGPDGKTYNLRGDDLTHFEFYGAPPILGPYFGEQFAHLLALP